MVIGTHRSRGFTLVEVLVALVIMAVLAAMAWQSLDSITRTRDASQQRLEQTLRLQTVIGQWGQDLSSIVDTGQVEALRCDGATVRLTRRTEGGVQLVVWSLRPPLGADSDSNAGNRFMRWAGPPVASRTALQEQWLRSQQFNGSEPGQVTTLVGVDGWQVYYYIGNAWANCQSTGNVQQVATPVAVAESAPKAAAPAFALPNGVRLVLQFGRGSRLTGTLTRDIALGPSS